MPAGKRGRKKKKKTGVKVIVWLVVIAIISSAAVFFVTKYYDEAKENLQKSNYPVKYSEYVEKYAAEYELDKALVYAMIRTESGFDPQAQSGAGAMGIMQMMPSSFEWLMEKRDEVGQYTSDDLFEPEICIDYGCYLLRLFYDYFNDERCAVAAYNAGFVVEEWLSDSQYSSDGKTLDTTPYPETTNYIDKVEEAKAMYNELYFSQNNQ